MARTRDVVVGVVIGLVFLIAFGFMALVFVGIMTGGGEFELAGVGGNIGVVEVFGVIDEELGRKVIKQIDDWNESRSIKAIVVHVNSPGGGVAISQEVYDAIHRAREEKPVVAAFASTAASGGYYIACAADRIVANPGSITGSIGVIIQFHTAYELLDKIGVGTETVKSSEMKDVGSYSKDMTEEERLMLRALVMDSYEQFVRAVAEGRSMNEEEVYPLADGSIYTGLQARSHGLVDTLGGLHEAVNLAADLAGVEGEPKVVRPVERRRFSWWDLLDEGLSRFQLPDTKEFSGPQLMYLFRLGKR